VGALALADGQTIAATTLQRGKAKAAWQTSVGGIKTVCRKRGNGEAPTSHGTMAASGEERVVHFGDQVQLMAVSRWDPGPR